MNTLVKKAQRGDAEAFISLMEECRMSFRRVAFGYLGNDEDVADAIQDTILDAFEHISSLKKAEYFRTWLTRILINECYRILDKEKRYMPYEERRDDRAQSMDLGNEYSEVYEALMTLKESYRLVFALHYVEGYSVKETAQILKISESTKAFAGAQPDERTVERRNGK